MTDVRTDPESLAGRRVTVMGLGQFGGGLGAVQYLLDQGALVTLTDLRPPDQLAESLARLDLSRIVRLTLGAHRLDDFTSAEIVVVNPAVKRPGNRYLDAALNAGCRLSSEMNLFWNACPSRKIVVTGTVGKSTTATLIHQCLQAAGIRTRLGGNIGVSLLPEIGAMSADEFVVLELSSFQLADLDRLQPRPEVAVVTNFHPNHLDWHGTLDSYRHAKQAALRWQTQDDMAVLNADDPDVRGWETNARSIWFGRSLAPNLSGASATDHEFLLQSPSGRRAIPFSLLSADLISRHQQLNVAAALAAVNVVVPDLAAALPALKAFQALPHRLNQVAVIQGRTFLNDSKATTPESAIAGLNAADSPVVLLAGGKDKGVDLSAFANEIARRVKQVVLMGETAPDLMRLLIACGRDDALFAKSLEEAMEIACARSAPGDAILLSPGCASEAPFLNYERRGERFVELVASLAGEQQKNFGAGL